MNHVVRSFYSNHTALNTDHGCLTIKICEQKCFALRLAVVYCLSSGLIINNITELSGEKPQAKYI